MHLAQDLRYALRLLRKSPGFTAAVLLMLALGIGANSAIFTIFNAVLLEPLSYRDPNALLLVTSFDPQSDASAAASCLSYPRFTMLRDRAGSFSGLAAYTNETFNLSSIGGDAEQVRAARVSWNFFDVLGVTPLAGRGFLRNEGAAGGSPAVLIGEGLWARRFGRRRDIVGQSITLDTRAYSVVGVLPHSFQFGLLGTEIEVWSPRPDELNLVTPAQVRGGVCYLNAVGRLRPGISRGAAQSEMNVLDSQYRREYPSLHDAQTANVVRLSPLSEQMVAGYRMRLTIIFGAVGLVLLIACANVANLLLARSVGRSREIAIRAALGATRRDLLRQLLTESALLSLLGGVLAMATGWLGARALASATIRVLPRANEIAQHAGWRVLLFTLALAILTGLLFGIAPALELIKASVNTTLREGGRGTTGGRGGNLFRNGLIAGQMALSVILMVAAGLLIRTFLELENVQAGVAPKGVITMNLALPPARYATPPQMVNFYDNLLNKIDAIPGVEAVAASSALPVNPIRFSPILAEGQPPLPLQQRPVVEILTFEHSYLRTLGIPLIRGRTFNDRDTADSPPVAVVNRTFARRFFPGRDAVGKHVWLGRRTVPNEIVGVAGDVKNVSLSGDTQPEVDLPFSQLPWPGMNLEVRAAAGDARSLVGPIRSVVASMDRDQPVTAVRTLDEVLDEARSQPRMLMLLLAAFAGSAFALALIGLYGIVSYSVRQRTQELGVRMALGAGKYQIVSMVLRQGAGLALTGIAAGLAVSLGAVRLLASVLFGVPQRDPVTFLLSPLLFLAAALAASALPALRAARVDPVDALRQE
jgi:putative ABC transport system permease protein